MTIIDGIYEPVKPISVVGKVKILDCVRRTNLQRMVWDDRVITSEFDHHESSYHAIEGYR